ncbi:NADP-dependent 3-hydroxy acid dehydrogenase YdfG [Serinibacter salmoneus]|uniref:NADP-dependent 3-hydroxy acid dehydrogenase YdfG n=2 Tax=Serinibacter salmoneus TaxID=556530 RepID=A0A2A9CYC3_9MICO|nr:NADP-dependent 3-hydroxy acid dehydrogenase YdfG [Serinibacter salmoneus]
MVAIVTGASRGIGRAIALDLAAAGFGVGLLARNGERLAQVAAEIRAAGGECAVATADVTDAGGAADAVTHLEGALGPTTLLVNNAGRIDAEVPLWEADVEQWRAVIETNLIGSFHVSRAVVPGMVARGAGRVVELASGAGARDTVVTSAYTDSKAALLRQVGHLHEAGFDLGLRAFGLAPGVVVTDMTSSMRQHEGRTDFTPVERTCEMIRAIATGELDAFSGCYLRVTYDSPASLRARLEKGALPPSARRLLIAPWGSDDPHGDGFTPVR